MMKYRLGQKIKVKDFARREFLPQYRIIVGLDKDGKKFYLYPGNLRLLQECSHNCSILNSAFLEKCVSPWLGIHLKKICEKC